MKNFKLLFVFMFVCLFSFMFMGTAYAYSEGTFGNEECTTDMAFLNAAKTEYSFDSATGQFSVSGKTAQEYRNTSTAQDIKLVFYEVSSDAKTLYAYVPSYTSSVGSEYTKKIIEDLGISSGYKCDEVIKVKKTAVEGEGQETPDVTKCPDGYVYDNNASKCVEDPNGVVEKMESPNTASPASIAAVSIGCLLVVLSVYLYKPKEVKTSKKK